ncbi:hypothetical protein GALL_435070 [mine drainage metagenome]|uniref:Uncharacterized protein n=1 Tax=mine drainage metagenome TaxID=410659 RepID=A0A1J5PUM7_9ZZZZ
MQDTGSRAGDHGHGEPRSWRQAFQGKECAQRRHAEHGHERSHRSPEKKPAARRERFLHQDENPARNGEQGHRRSGTGLRQAAAGIGVDERVGGKRRAGDEQAAGHGEAQNAPDEAGLCPLVVSFEGQEKGGDADGQRPDQGQVARQEGERDIGDADSKRQEHRIDCFGQEQRCQPFDVADHAAALRDDRRQAREPIVEEDEVRDGAGGPGTGAHRYADVGALQRQDVVDAVAHHRDHVAFCLK